MNSNYQVIETNFYELIHSLNKKFTPEEVNEVLEFINYGEYGLALDTVVDIITEENKEIDSQSFNLLVQLSNLMSLDTDLIIKKLTSHYG